jgi:hypothetical protein
MKDPTRKVKKKTIDGIVVIILSYLSKHTFVIFPARETKNIELD